MHGLSSQALADLQMRQKEVCVADIQQCEISNQNVKASIKDYEAKLSLEKEQGASTSKFSTKELEKLKQRSEAKTKRQSMAEIRLELVNRP